MADIERGQRIKARREELGYSQPEMVEEIERLAWALPATNRLHPDQPKLKDPEARSKGPVTLRGYQSWEAGGGIDPGKAKLLAEVLQLDVRWLMNGLPADAPTPDPFPHTGEDSSAILERLAHTEAQLQRMEDRLERMHSMLVDGPDVLARLETIEQNIHIGLDQLGRALSRNAAAEAGRIVEGIEEAWKAGKLPALPPASSAAAARTAPRRTRRASKPGPA